MKEIHRITFDTKRNEHYNADDGEFVLYTDHLAAMQEQHERDMRFALWIITIPEANGLFGIGNQLMCFDKAFEYWKYNVDGTE